jgi:carbamoyl-phosphate synthase large subunit
VILDQLGLRQPPNDTAIDLAGARRVAERIGYPVLIRPSFVLGGRAMEICYDEAQLVKFTSAAVDASQGRPVLIDKFLEDATEVDVDALADGADVIVGGIMEHVEEAGVHSGDSACALPPTSLPKSVIAEIREATHKLARALQVRGLMNIQFAVKEVESRGLRGEGQLDAGPTGSPLAPQPSALGPSHTVYVLEVNPRASRTSPFVSKATGRPLAKIAAKIMVGVSLREQGVTEEIWPKYTAVKESVFPFNRFHGVDIILGPEMRSTGEVMGIDKEFSIAFAKSQIGAGARLPTTGSVFISMAGRHKQRMIEPVRRLRQLGFKILATSGTARVLSDAGLEVTIVKKLQEGRPNLLDHMANGDVQLIFNTPSGKGARTDEGKIRAAAVIHGISCATTLPGCFAVVRALEALASEPVARVRSIQEWLNVAEPMTTATR